MVHNKLVLVIFITLIVSNSSFTEKITVPNELLKGILKFDLNQFVPFQVKNEVSFS